MGLERREERVTTVREWFLAVLMNSEIVLRCCELGCEMEEKAFSGEGAEVEEADSSDSGEMESPR